MTAPRGRPGAARRELNEGGLAIDAEARRTRGPQGADSTGQPRPSAHARSAHHLRATRLEQQLRARWQVRRERRRRPRHRYGGRAEPLRAEEGADEVGPVGEEDGDAISEADACSSQRLRAHRCASGAASAEPERLDRDALMKREPRPVVGPSRSRKPVATATRAVVTAGRVHSPRACAIRPHQHERCMAAQAGFEFTTQHAPAFTQRRAREHQLTRPTPMSASPPRRLTPRWPLPRERPRTLKHPQRRAGDERRARLRRRVHAPASRRPRTRATFFPRSRSTASCVKPEGERVARGVTSAAVAACTPTTRERLPGHQHRSRRARRPTPPPSRTAAAARSASRLVRDLLERPHDPR
jgi:hypothetical protein